MQTFRWASIKGRPLKILCLGAHGDDIEIGCGGTILRLLAERADAEVRWVVFSSGGPRAGEAERSAKRFLAGAKHRDISIGDFEDGLFPARFAELKRSFEELKMRASPDVIFTHGRQDLHQDHRLLSELTWQTFRQHLILEYEVIKYDGDLGTPNVFVHLSEGTARKKAGYLVGSFKSQAGKDWFTEDAFLSVLRIRGIESRAPEGYAEAFTGRKLVI